MQVSGKIGQIVGCPPPLGNPGSATANRLSRKLQTTQICHSLKILSSLQMLKKETI